MGLRKTRTWKNYNLYLKSITERVFNYTLKLDSSSNKTHALIWLIYI